MSDETHASSIGGRSPMMMPSPFLTFDPAYIQTAPEFILPEGQSAKRGRLELAFSQIGSAVIVGGLLGGSNGMLSGLHERKTQQLSGKVGNTVLWNHVTKRGASHAQSLGIVALLYSCLGVGISKLRGSADDELNTLAAGTLTGALYRAPAGLVPSGRGALIGLALAVLYSAGHALIMQPDRFRYWSSHLGLAKASAATHPHAHP